MSQESGAKESRAFTLSLVRGAGVYSVSIDPDNMERTTAALNELLRIAVAPLLAEIETFKKRVLSPEEIERFIHLLNLSGTELKLDGKPTNDDLLIKKLEGMLKS